MKGDWCWRYDEIEELAKLRVRFTLTPVDCGAQGGQGAIVLGQVVSTPTPSPELARLYRLGQDLFPVFPIVASYCDEFGFPKK